MHRLSEGLAAQLTQIDYEQHMAFVAENLKGEIVAVARFARDTLKKSAECAVIVRTDLQRRGLGSQMHGLIEDYAISRGITELWGVVAPDNLRALVSRFRNSLHQISASDEFRNRKDTSQPINSSVVLVPKFASGADISDVANFGTTTLAVC
jgi:GNAT superfamily N-acetyltransferase